MKTVGIIGGSGFIGSYIIKKFLAEDYTVKVSATDISRPDKYEHLPGLHGKNYQLTGKSWKVSDISSMLNSAMQELGMQYPTPGTT